VCCAKPLSRSGAIQVASYITKETLEHSFNPTHHPTPLRALPTPLRALFRAASLFTMAKPTAKSTPTRAGPGRPKKAEVLGAAPVVATDLVEPEPEPKQRGRPKTKSRPAAAAAETIATLPKKRAAGRPPKAATDSTLNVELEPTPATPKKRGRPSKAATETIAILPKSRPGRPRKETTTTASLLNRIAGSPRVSKRAPAKRASPQVSRRESVARINPRVGSKLRTRTAPVKKELESAKKAPKTKKATKATKATAGLGRGRPRKDASAPVSAKNIPKTARQAISKPVAPRKRRGYTTFEVPDKFAAQMQKYLLDLKATTKEAEEEQDHIVQDQEVNAEANSIDQDEDAEEGAQEEVQLVIVAKPAEEETYEEEAEDFAGDLDEMAGEIEVEYEIREETIIEEPTNQDFQMQGSIEDELNRAVSSELTPSYNDDFEELAHEASILQQSLGADEARGLFA
jgi:hypothetical protein